MSSPRLTPKDLSRVHKTPNCPQPSKLSNRGPTPVKPLKKQQKPPSERSSTDVRDHSLPPTSKVCRSSTSSPAQTTQKEPAVCRSNTSSLDQISQKGPTSTSLKKQQKPPSESSATDVRGCSLPPTSKECSNFSDKLNFKMGNPAPKKMSRPIDGAVYNEFAYFRPYRKKSVEMYDSKKETFSTLPDCLVSDTSLVVLPVHTGTDTVFFLHTVGGLLGDTNSTVTGELYCLNCLKENECSTAKSTTHYWTKSSFPSMKEKRKQVIVVRYGNHLIVAGGRGARGPSRTVEVLNLKTNEWSFVASLPRAVFSASGCICGDYLYILGGCVLGEDGSTQNIKFSCRASLSKLIQSRDDDIGIFHAIGDLRLFGSVCTAFCNQIFAIGGSIFVPEANEARSSNLVYVYHPKDDSWKENSTLVERRCRCFAVSLMHPRPQLMVVGGYTHKPDENCTNSVEIAELDTSLCKYDSTQPSHTQERKEAFEEKAQQMSSAKKQTESSNFLNFKMGNPAPNKMSRPIDGVVHDEIAYFRPYREKLVVMYDSSKKLFSKLPECLVNDTSLAVLPVRTDAGTDFLLHTVGGLLCEGDNAVTGKLYYLKDPKCTTRHWEESPFPSMGVERKQVTTVCYGNYLIAAGGRGAHGPSKTVEVLDLENNKWSVVASLPQAVFSASGCICGDYLYILGGCVLGEDGNTQNIKSSHRASLSELIQSCGDDIGIFHAIGDLCLHGSACTTFCNRIFAIGGSKFDSVAKEARSSNLVYVFHPEDSSWKENSYLVEKRCKCFAVSFMHPRPQLMVVGGYTRKPDENCTNSVEIAELNASSCSGDSNFSEERPCNKKCESQPSQPQEREATKKKAMAQKQEMKRVTERKREKVDLGSKCKPIQGSSGSKEGFSSQAQLPEEPKSSVKKPTETHETESLESLIERYSISSDQLDSKILEKDVAFLAQYFGNVELYLRVFGLTIAEQVNVRRTHDNQIAMAECLSLWRRHKPSTATLRALLEILLRLRKEDIASEVCKYYHPKHQTRH